MCESISIYTARICAVKSEGECLGEEREPTRVGEGSEGEQDP